MKTKIKSVAKIVCFSFVFFLSASVPTAEATGGLGAWLAKKQIIGGPPNTYHGCVLGPLAIAQAIILLKSRSSLKKTRNKLQGVTTDMNSIENFYAENIPDVEIPCVEDPSQTCLLTNNGETITSLYGGPPISVSELAANLPSNIEGMEAEAIQQALDENPDIENMMVQARAANPGNTGSSSFSGNSGNGGSGNGGTNVIAGNTAPAFNFDPLRLGGNGFVGGTGTGSLAGASVFENAGGNTPELPAPPAGVYDDQGSGFGSGSFAGDTFNNNEGDSPTNYAAAAADFSRQFAGNTWEGQEASGKNTGNNIKSIPYGKDKVGDVSVDMFNAIRNKYQSYTDSGQFIPPSNSGAVVTPTLPSAME